MGISETGAELGGALGIALLGSIGVAIYRRDLANSLPGGVPAQAVNAASETLGGAVGVAGTLPPGIADALLVAARAAFVDGMHVTAAIAAVVGVALATFAFFTLRDEPAAQPIAEPGSIEELAPRLAPKPARECF
jgi:DHA2 family multidrug resistance protein-like MFS transporter